MRQYVKYVILIKLTILTQSLDEIKYFNLQELLIYKHTTFKLITVNRQQSTNLPHLFIHNKSIT